MGFPVVAMALVSTAAAGKTVTDIAAAQEQKNALNAQRQEEHLQYLQKSNDNYAQVQSILSKQINEASGRGIALSSPSFNAIQRDTFNTFSKEQSNLDTEMSFIDRNIASEKRNVNLAMISNIFGNVASAASMDFDIFNAAGSAKTDAPIVEAKPSYVAKSPSYKKITKKGLW